MDEYIAILSATGMVGVATNVITYVGAKYLLPLAGKLAARDFPDVTERSILEATIEQADKTIAFCSQAMSTELLYNQGLKLANYQHKKKNEKLYGGKNELRRL